MYNIISHVTGAYGIYIGNSLRDACRYSPGSSPHAINVGATKMEDGEDKLYDTFFSGTNFGPCVALYAPGESVSSVNKQ